MAEIEYFYSAHSAFAFLGSARLMEIARAAGRRIAHRPMDLHRVMAETGASAFAERPKTYRAYFFGREIGRWAEHRGVDWLGRRPTHHDNGYMLANAVLIAAQIQGHTVDRLAHAMLVSHWRDDSDLADPETLAELSRSVGLDPQPLLDAAGSTDVAAAHEENTAEAIRRSVFGSPTYFVDGDMFYGQDRLELVERALRQPYSGTWSP